MDGRSPPPARPDPLSTLWIAGVAYLAAGGFSLVWGGIMALEVAFVASGGFDHEIRRGEAPARAFLYAMFAGFFILSFAGGLVQIVAGICLFRRKRGTLTLATVAAIVSVVSLWACCAYPFALAAGITSLVLLARDEVRAALAA